MQNRKRDTYVLLIFKLVNAHLDCFQNPGSISNATMAFLVSEVLQKFVWDGYIGVELLGQ